LNSHIKIVIEIWILNAPIMYDRPTLISKFTSCRLLHQTLGTRDIISPHNRMNILNSLLCLLLS